MATYKRELSNLSYTNKDFGQIYPELLDLAKKISYKWDPSLSDESDPGVVLLKLAALMADKCNYNIDKNVLELFPASVTQLSNARQLFDQCGYTMRYYNSATTFITCKMLNEPEITDDDAKKLLNDATDANTIKSDDAYVRQYIIPKFTMFSDTDNSVVYTITDELHVSSDGTASSAEAIQGTVNQYSINGSTSVTADMLDSNRRLYFTEINIPENGIFISNVESSDYWKAVDNLFIQPQGTRCYKFGLTLDGRRCYVEFPTDIDELIGKGIQIHYVLTSGFEGNIGRHVIRQFFSETNITRRIGEYPKQETALTTDNVYIINEEPARNGRNPETIDEAYRNYQKVKTTFNTLVSTKDYTDFLRTNQDVSNCVVCDRSDDIQSTYHVLHDIDGVHQLISSVRQQEKTITGRSPTDLNKPLDVIVTEDEMTAFDLRVYGLKYVDNFTDYKNFSKSFEVLNFGTESGGIERSTADIKCLSHNYLDFEKDRIILLKNRYPIIAKIVSPYRLALSQQEEIINSVKLNLFALLNSQIVEFGQEIDYNLVYDTILKSDPRISALILEEIKYETYAVYLSSMTEKLEILRIDSLSNPPSSSNAQETEFLTNLWNEFRTDVYARSVLSGKTPLFIPENTFMYSLIHEQAHNGNSTYQVTELSSSVNIPLEYDPNSRSFVSRVLRPNEVITLTSPNLVMDQRYATYCQFVTNIGTGIGRQIKDADGNDFPLTRPEYSDDLEIVVRKNTDYVLKNDEYIVFFWRTTDSASEPYTYVKYTGRNSDSPTIINPSFNIVRQPNTDNMSGASYTINDELFMSLGDRGTRKEDYVEQVQLTLNLTDMYMNMQNAEGKPAITLNNFINRYIIGERFSVGSNSIETKKVNKIHLNNNKDGTTRFYWILNNTYENERGNSVYRLFGRNDHSYTLQDGEQLIYSNSTSTQLYVLGAGTLLERSTQNNGTFTVWECPALEHKLEFLQVGPKYFEDSSHPWFSTSESAKGCNLYATEMMYKKLAADTKLTIELPENTSLVNEDFNYFITSEGIMTPDGKDATFHIELCSFIAFDEFGEKESLANRHHLDLQWNCRSSLNFNMSYDNPQRLYSNQKISWTPIDEQLTYELEGSDTEERYIQSERPIIKSGGQNINVEYYDVLTEDNYPLSIYIYRLKDIDMSTSMESDHKDIPWRFSSTQISISGNDVSLTGISLPEGDYILPVKMSRVTTPIDVYWTELRKLSKYKLNSAERNLISSLQPADSATTGMSDWEQARKPVDLADVASWIYGTAYIDVTKEFGNYSVDGAYNSLFYCDMNIPYDGADVSRKFSLRTDNDPDKDSILSTMLVGYGGSELQTMKEFTAFETGDIICVKDTSEDLLNTTTTYHVWVYTSEVSTGQVFIQTNFGVGVSSVCKRRNLTDLQELQNTCDYYFVLRPSNITEKTNTSVTPVTRCNTITGVVPRRNITYYFLLHSNNGSSYTLRLSKQSTETSSSTPLFEILNPVKYSKAVISDAAQETLPFFDDVLTTIAKLDVDSIFDFTYKIPDSQLIMYPLDAISFLDSNHPMNRFTICQYIINENKYRNDLVVVGKSR